MTYMTLNRNSKYTLIAVVCLVFLVLVFYYTRGMSSGNADTSIGAGEVVDISDIPIQERGSRYRLLEAMTQSDKVSYAKDQTFLLDESDPTSKVIIGSYKADDFGQNGGIIMLKELSNGGYSIYWEITSPMFWGPTMPKKLLQDINGDGAKELITYWGSNLSSNQDTVTEYWIMTLGTSNKKYRVLNPVIDKDKNILTDFNLASANPEKGIYFNRFQTNSLKTDILQDIDKDGVPEIVINTPALEYFDVVAPSPEMSGKGRKYNQIYKWDGSKYFLWKEVTELPISN